MNAVLERPFLVVADKPYRTGAGRLYCAAGLKGTSSRAADAWKIVMRV
jgi:hypothetical protein